MNGTDRKVDTPTARGDSRPVRYRLISPEGKLCGSYKNVERAKRAGRKRWPDVPRDDRNEDPGAWDVWVSESQSALAASSTKT